MPEQWIPFQLVDSSYQLSTRGYGGDKVTAVHEDTHGVNSKLRNSLGGNCYQLYEGVYVRFASTPRSVTLRQVADACEWRGDIYRLYMVSQQRWWNDTPLYPYDEWVAYSNGGWQQLLDGGTRGSSDITYPYSMEMATYCHAAAFKVMPEDWEDTFKLRAFWIWYAEVNIELSLLAEGKNFFSDKHRDRRERLQALIDQEKPYLEGPHGRGGGERDGDAHS